MLLCEFFLNFSISFVASIFAILVALWVERKRLPLLKITASENSNAVLQFQNNNENDGTWKFFRLHVANVPFPKLFSWIPRYTAINCNAELEFRKDNNELLFIMKGRWASTPELAFLTPESKYVKMILPDTVSLTQTSEPEILDVFAQQKGDENAYGWNNESYIISWKNNAYLLNPGIYKLKVTVKAENGIEVKELFQCIINENYLESKIVCLKKYTAFN